MQSGIDEAVRQHRANETHDFETIQIDGSSRQFCKRCGRSEDMLRIVAYPPEYLPCRGFVGDGL